VNVGSTVGTQTGTSNASCSAPTPTLVGGGTQLVQPNGGGTGGIVALSNSYPTGNTWVGQAIVIAAVTQSQGTVQAFALCSP
jgi:hypothetical protein